MWGVTAVAQPNKGKRRLVGARLPNDLMGHVQTCADADRLSRNEAVAMADLAAMALGEPLPSQVLPRPKARQQEELPIAMTA